MAPRWSRDTVTGNPNCNKCESSINAENNDNFLQCSKCMYYYHRICTPVKQAHFNELNKTDCSSRFFCNNCLATIDQELSMLTSVSDPELVPTAHPDVSSSIHHVQFNSLSAKVDSLTAIVQQLASKHVTPSNNPSHEGPPQRQGRKKGNNNTNNLTVTATSPPAPLTSTADIIVVDENEFPHLHPQSQSAQPDPTAADGTGWQPGRRTKKFKATVGTASAADAACPLKGVPGRVHIPKAVFYVKNLDPGTTEDELKEYLSSNQVTMTNILSFPQQETVPGETDDDGGEKKVHISTNARITVHRSDAETMRQSSFWSKHIEVRDWKFKPSRKRSDLTRDMGSNGPTPCPVQPGAPPNTGASQNLRNGLTNRSSLN